MLSRSPSWIGMREWPVTLISSWIPKTGVSGSGHDVRPRDHDLGGVEVPEDDGPGEQPVGKVLDDPFLRPVPIITARSSAEWPTSKASVGRTPEKAEHSVGTRIEKSDQGRKTRMKPRNGKARSTAVRSGAEIVMFFGAISPITMCRNTTMRRAMTREMP